MIDRFPWTPDAPAVGSRRGAVSPLVQLFTGIKYFQRAIDLLHLLVVSAL